MRVCIVTVAGHGIGGMQDHTRGLAAGLVAAGHEVEVVADRHPEGLPGEERDGAQWHYLPFASHHPRLPRRDANWIRASYVEFRRLHGRRPFDVVHSESSSAVELVRRGVHRELPVVPKFHGNGIALARAALRRFRAGTAPVKVREAKGLVWLLGENFQQGHWYRFRPCHWMVPSLAEFDDTRRDAFLRAELGHVVPNGVDASLFRPRDRSEARAELGLGPEPLFVCAGRLEAEKGIHRAIDALVSLDGTQPQPRLVVLGDGPERRALEARARGLGVGDRVLFLGARRHDELALHIAASDGFLFPTERAEAAPLILPQAMACGVPVIASSVAAVVEVVERGGESGVLVPPGDTAALARAMRTLLADEPLRLRLGAAARARVLAEYTIEAMIERTLAVYESALAASPAGRNRKPR